MSKHSHNIEVIRKAALIGGLRGTEARDRCGVVCGGLVVSIVARQYDVNANQMFSWLPVPSGVRVWLAVERPERCARRLNASSEKI
jgi:hypothetical protein